MGEEPQVHEPLRPRHNPLGGVQLELWMVESYAAHHTHTYIRTKMSDYREIGGGHVIKIYQN